MSIVNYLIKSFLGPYTKIESRWIKDLTVKINTLIKLSKNMTKILINSRVEKGFLNKKYKIKREAVARVALLVRECPETPRLQVGSLIRAHSRINQ